MDQQVSIRQWPRGERPRERLLERGAHTLSDAELLAVVLGTGSAGANALDIARQLLQHFGGSLRRLLTSEADSLLALRGLMQSDPDRAVSMVQQVLTGSSSIKVAQLKEGRKGYGLIRSG